MWPIDYRIAPLPLTLNDLKVTFAVSNVLNSHTLGNMACVTYDMFTRVEQENSFKNFKRFKCLVN